MKNHTILGILTFLLSSPLGITAADHNTVHLKGQLIDMGSNHVEMTYDGAASLVGDSRTIMLHTDKAGNFDTTFVLKAPAFYRISRNTLYLSPGDDMTVHITTNNKEASFTGKGAVANEYMKYRLFPKGGSYLEGGSNLRADFPKTKALVDSLAAIRRQQLNSLKGVSEEFKKLENARITADVLNSYICYGSYSRILAGVKSEDEMKQKLNGFYQTLTAEAKPIYRELAKDELMDVAVVRDVMSYIVAPDMDACKAWAEGITLSPRIKEMYEAANKVRILREKVDPATLDSIVAFTKNLNNKDFSDELQGKIQQARKLMKGSPAIDITFTDVEGNTHHLSDFKGKAIYLDFWATWCGPCIHESPYFEALSKEYAGKNIVFIPISTDTAHKAWLNFLKAHKKELKQYNCVDDKLRSEWAIFYIPRFVLIDKDFNIVDAYAPRPSEDAAKTLINTLLK